MTLIEGDGIGPEISAAVVKIFEAVQVSCMSVSEFWPGFHALRHTSLQVPLSWEPVSVAPVKMPDGQVSIPEEVITSMKNNKIGLKGTPTNN